MAASDVSTPTLVIQLSQGLFAIIDEDDADLAKLTWHAGYYSKNDSYYARRNLPEVNGVRSSELMHRAIMARVLGRPLIRSEQVDHIRRIDTLDNRRENLRLATKSQNMCNRGTQLNNTSGYKGVSLHKASQLWRARINVNGKEWCIGYFHTPLEAALAYDNVVEEWHGEFATKNFP